MRCVHVEMLTNNNFISAENVNLLYVNNKQFMGKIDYITHPVQFVK